MTKEGKLKLVITSITNKTTKQYDMTSLRLTDDTITLDPHIIHKK